MKKIWMIILSVVILVFIWGQSAIPTAQSAKESGWLTNHIINPILQFIGLESVRDHVVRKAAHITEFFVFSAVVAQLWKGRPLGTLFTGLLVAFLDESIQILSHRGAQVSDVWIDLIGVVLGTLVGCLVWWLNKRIRRRKMGAGS